MAKKNVRVKDRSPSDLPVKLSDAEMLEFVDELVEVEKDIDKAEAEADEEKKKWKRVIDELHKRSKEVMTILSDKAEMRPVDVEEILDYDKQQWRRVRTDTKEVLTERPMNDDERQMELS